jgi:hypothetical protein
MLIPDEKLIESSKIKIKIMIFIFLMFSSSGLWVITFGATKIQSILHLNYPTSAYALGWFFLLTFGYGAYLWIKKLTSASPGLILNHLGITENSTSLPAGFIPWDEISGFSMRKIRGKKLILVLLKNVEIYIEAPNLKKRYVYKSLLKKLGSPVVITDSLMIDMDELLSICNEYFKKYGKTT